MLIQSQAGVEEFGQLIFGYSSATENSMSNMSACASPMARWW